MRRFLLLGAALALASPLMLGQASAAGMAVPQMKAAQSAAAAGAIVEKAGLSLLPLAAQVRPALGRRHAPLLSLPVASPLLIQALNALKAQGGLRRGRPP